MEFFATIVLLIFLGSSYAGTHKRHHKWDYEEFSYGKSRSDKSNQNPAPAKAVKLSETPLIKYVIKEHEDYNEVQRAQCSDDMCPSGQHCNYDIAGSTMCSCDPEGSCAPGHRLVCGTDGNLYNSHCELRRKACESELSVRVDKSGNACLQKAMMKEKILSSLTKAQLEQQNEEVHVPSIKKDLGLTEVKTAALKTDETEWCTADLFEDYKELITEYHCNRMALYNCHDSDMKVTTRLLDSMFQYYDTNKDEAITLSEFKQLQDADHLEKISHICTLGEMIVFRPEGAKANALTKSDFYKLFGVEPVADIIPTAAPQWIVSVDNNIRVISVIADGLNRAELSCMIEQRSEIVWMRNQRILNSSAIPGIVLIAPRLLYISPVGLAHTGNYSCYDELNTDNKDNMQLLVLTEPTVKIKDVGTIMEKVTSSLTCHAYGVPQPKVYWMVNNYDLPSDSTRYDWTNDNSTVQILSPDPKKDSASYQCLAKSESGWKQAEQPVKVLDRRHYISDIGGEYIVFHGNGYTVYSVNHCAISHDVPANAADFKHHNVPDISPSLETLCHAEKSCAWGSAVNVKNKYIFVSQPNEYRILMIDIHANYRPIHVIILEHAPTKLRYLQESDQLWILAGNQKQFQIAMILPDASVGIEVTPKILLPYHNIFDAVVDLYLPQETVLDVDFQFGFASHFDELQLSRIDLMSMQYSGSTDFTSENCYPSRMEYLVIGGLGLVECTHPDLSISTVLVDVLTNQIVRHFSYGHAHVSPDSRYIVSIKDGGETEDLAQVFYVHDNVTIQHLYDTKVFKIAQVQFMDSKWSRGHDLIIISRDGSRLEFFDMKRKRAESLDGLNSGHQGSASEEELPILTTSGEFNDFLLTSCNGDLFIINKQYRFIKCQFTHIEGIQIALWID